MATLTERIFYTIIILFLPIYLLGQQKVSFDSIIENIIEQSRNNSDVQISIFNEYENIAKNEAKAKFIRTLNSIAVLNKNENLILFANFLKGELSISELKIEEATERFKYVWIKSKDGNHYNELLLGSIGLQSIFELIGNKDSVELYSQYGKESFKKSTNPFALGFYQRRLGTLEIKKGNYNAAINHLLEVVENPSLKKSCINSLALMNIGWIYEQLNYPEKAKIYYSRAKTVSTSIGNQSYLNFTNLKLAHIELFNNGNPKGALESYKKLERIYAGTNKYQEGILYGTMGFAFLKTDDDANSINYLIKSRDFFEVSKDSSFLCLPYSYLSHYYAENKQFDLSIYNGEKALTIIAKKSLFDARKLIPLEALAISYKALQHNEKAYAMLNELNNIKTNLENKKNNVAFLEGQYELLESTEKLKISELNNQLLKKNKIIYISVLVILFILLLFTAYFNKIRKKHYSQLKTLSALKSNFFANISHEFRTPLTLISHPIEAALEEPNLSAEKRSHFEMASRNTKRLLLLVDQLLDLSKIDSGAMTLHLEKGFPTLLLAALSESFSYLAKQKDIQFKIAASDKDLEGWYDRDALEKVAVNLLGNAIKYTPENGIIEVHISMIIGYVNFEVRNSGKSLTKEQMKTIFERFYQTDGFSDGVGIGLSLVKELTKLHNGTISVEQKQDKWTIFKAQLCVDKCKLKNMVLTESTEYHKTRSQMTLTMLPPEEEQDIEENGLPILLIVEDNLDVQVLLTDTFKSTYNIFIANNGKEGILTALEIVPDIIVSDVMMPIKDGIELTKILKKDERTSHIPIVLLTAKAGDKNKLMGFEVGADDYITKPFNQRLLRSKMDNLIALRKKLRSRYSQEVILRPKDIAITSVDEKFLEKVQMVLDKNLVESSFTIDGFSEAVHMSRMQLHRKLKALTGLSASEFVRSQRLKLAAGILKQSDINISEVGYLVGFNDPAYFSKCFKDAYKCTPSQFVNQ